MTSVRNATATTVRGPDLPVTGVRNDTATTVCGQCGADFTAVGRRRWCSDACRQAAWRRRRAAPRPTQPAKIDTVYESAMPNPVPRQPALRGLQHLVPSPRPGRPMPALPVD